MFRPGLGSGPDQQGAVAGLLARDSSPRSAGKSRCGSCWGRPSLWGRGGRCAVNQHLDGFQRRRGVRGRAEGSLSLSHSSRSRRLLRSAHERAGEIRFVTKHFNKYHNTFPYIITIRHYTNIFHASRKGLELIALAGISPPMSARRS